MHSFSPKISWKIFIVDGYLNKHSFGRWLLVDFLRGFFILIMVVYHAIWNLAYFRFLPQSLLTGLAWETIGYLIAGSFLMISGISLSLAHRPYFNIEGFIKRLLKLILAAALVTLVTWFVFPDSYIFFGILHCLAVSSILALPFLKAPIWLILIVIIFSLVLPEFFTQSFWDTPWLEWLGFGNTLPITNDYVPVFPWFSFVLIGLLIGRIPKGMRMEVQRTSYARFLITAGRWSLVIYLLHQPILFTATQLGAMVFPPKQEQLPSVVFQKECEDSCIATNVEISACRRMCLCTTKELFFNPANEDIKTALQHPEKLPQIQNRVTEIANACAKKAGQEHNEQ
ncbi:heparan-alpha-glucosaminide N-acetyltransferase [Microvirga sp. W0021]|uniref:Heparan-alpha-glucosaminide N-acetyltransferase n=1 Tax=Hohaiivirga grylli TaxID=3133970 RepID=A0ABV0BIH4_9HYPH